MLKKLRKDLLNKEMSFTELNEYMVNNGFRDEYNDRTIDDVKEEGSIIYVFIGDDVDDGSGNWEQIQLHFDMIEDDEEVSILKVVDVERWRTKEREFDTIKEYLEKKQYVFESLILKEEDKSRDALSVFQKDEELLNYLRRYHKDCFYFNSYIIDGDELVTRMIIIPNFISDSWDEVKGVI